MSTRDRRPWLAALLALVYPGLGHVYLREWARALLWFVLALGSVLVLWPASEPAPTVAGLLGTTGTDLPLGVLLAVSTVTAFSVADAYWLASREPTEAEGPTCPSCGRTLDEEIDFCPWCTERLDERNA